MCMYIVHVRAVHVQTDTCTIAYVKVRYRAGIDRLVLWIEGQPRALHEVDERRALIRIRRRHRHHLRADRYIYKRDVTYQCFYRHSREAVI